MSTQKPLHSGTQKSQVTSTADLAATNTTASSSSSPVVNSITFYQPLPTPSTTSSSSRAPSSPNAVNNSTSLSSINVGLDYEPEMNPVHAQTIVSMLRDFRQAEYAAAKETEAKAKNDQLEAEFRKHEPSKKKEKKEKKGGYRRFN